MTKKYSYVYIEKHEVTIDNGYAIRWILITELAEEGKTADEIDFIKRSFGL